MFKELTRKPERKEGARTHQAERIQTPDKPLSVTAFDQSISDVYDVKVL